MSEWFYISAAYLVTWIVLAGYAVYLRSRRQRANAGLQRVFGPEGSEP